MAKYVKVTVIYKMYHDFKLQVVEHTVGAKMIDRQRISGLHLYKDTPENREKARESNRKLEEIKRLQMERREIEFSMEDYVE